MRTQPKHRGACALCPIPSTSVIVGKLYSQFNKKLLEFLIASYIPYCDNFTAKLRSVRPRQHVARTGDTSVSKCQFTGPCRHWQELAQGRGLMTDTNNSTSMKFPQVVPACPSGTGGKVDC